MPTKAIPLPYRKLINNTPDTSLVLREKWTTDLGKIDDDEWLEARASPKKSAIRY